MIEIPKFDELTFDEGPHIYRLYGSEIPSVSAVMEPLSNFEYGSINEKVLNNAAERGTSVHNSIENWIKFGINDTDDEYMGYFRGFEEWWNINKPEVIGSEMRVYHKLLRYAGTIDLLAIIDGKITVVDFKTTSRLVEKNCGVQLEAYAQALGSHGISVEGKRILHLSIDGKWNEVIFPEKDMTRWRVFGSLKTIYDYIN